MSESCIWVNQLNCAYSSFEAPVRLDGKSYDCDFQMVFLCLQALSKVFWNLRWCPNSQLASYAQVSAKPKFQTVMCDPEIGKLIVTHLIIRLVC